MFVPWINVMFIGEHIAKLDDKGRLVFPAPLKAQAESEKEGKLIFIMQKNRFEKCIDMLTEKEWKQQCDEAAKRLNRHDPDHARLWRALMQDTAIVEPDEKMGRIQIPKTMLEKIDVCKEVVFAGNGYKIEVWAKEHHPGGKVSEKDFVVLSKKYLR